LKSEKNEKYVFSNTDGSRLRSYLQVCGYTFPARAQKASPISVQYQIIILLGDRGTCVWSLSHNVVLICPRNMTVMVLLVH